MSKPQAFTVNYKPERKKIRETTIHKKNGKRVQFLLFFPILELCAPVLMNGSMYKYLLYLPSSVSNRNLEKNQFTFDFWKLFSNIQNIFG